MIGFAGLIGWFLGQSNIFKTIGCTNLNYIYGDILKNRYGNNVDKIPQELNVAFSTDFMRLCHINPFDEKDLQSYSENNMVKKYLEKLKH